MMPLSPAGGVETGLGAARGARRDRGVKSGQEFRGVFRMYPDGFGLGAGPGYLPPRRLHDGPKSLLERHFLFMDHQRYVIWRS